MDISTDIWTYLLIGMPLLAMALDLAVGDPPGLPHPVRLLGWAADRLEALARAWTGSPGGLRLAGALAVTLLALAAGGAALGLSLLPVVGPALALYLGFSGLALGQLMREGNALSRRIDSGDVDGARKALAMLVSRDTEGLDAAQLRRGLAETLSENLCDAFVAPLFWLLVGGPGALWAYKAVSTLDSMWGYRTEQWKNLGRAAARLDDLLAFIPARLTWLFLLGAGGLLGLDAATAIRRSPADARTMDSPNAGWPMAAAAWLVGAAMGGPTSYFGVVKDKPLLGPSGEDGAESWDRDKLRLLSGLILVAGLLGGLAVWAVVTGLRSWW